MSRHCFVLVHGAWHGAWAWQRVAKRLRDYGQQVLAVDLPGYGTNKDDHRPVTLDRYIEHVIEVISQQKRPVILIGHDLGGMVISGVAERVPQRVHHLIYVAAYLLPSGDSVLSRMQVDQNQNAMSSLRYTDDQREVTLQREHARRYLYNRCDEQDVETALRTLTPQATFPLMSPLKLSDQHFGAIPRSYVRCLQDHMISAATQAELVEAMPCRRVIDLDADHSPFLSASDGLARALLDVAAQEVNQAA
jgi:pimeloyl-ACP methyl ester carboxylesterase